MSSHADYQNNMIYKNNIMLKIIYKMVYTYHRQQTLMPISGSAALTRDLETSERTRSYLLISLLLKPITTRTVTTNPTITITTNSIRTITTGLPSPEPSVKTHHQRNRNHKTHYHQNHNRNPHYHQNNHHNPTITRNITTSPTITRTSPQAPPSPETSPQAPPSPETSPQTPP